MNIQAPFTLASVYPLGVWRSLGLRLRGLRQFQAFWPLALVQQALAALVFVVRGLCGHFRFCALGLTWRSSRPAYCGRLILFVRALCVLDRSPNPGVAIGSAIAGPSGCLWLAFRLRSCLPSQRKSCSEPPASSFSSAQWCCGVRHGVTRPFASRAGHVPVAVSLGCQIRRLGLVLLACVQTAGSVSMKRLNRLVKRTCASYAGWSAFLFYIALVTLLVLGVSRA